MKKSRKRLREKQDYSGLLMIAPAYSIYLIFVFLPLVLAIGYSFTNYDFYKTKEFIGLANYIKVFKDELFIQSIGNTLYYSVFVIVIQMALGLVLANYVNRNLIGKKFYRAAIYLPNVLSMVAVSMIWLYMYDPTMGILNRFVKLIGIAPQKWLFNTSTAMPSIIVMSIWRSVGYTVVTYLAGLQNISPSYYEAAEIDGANEIQKFFRITVPLLKNTTFFLFVITTIQSFNVFEQVNIMTDGGPMNSTTTIVHQIYTNAFRDFKMGYASAMAVLLFIVTLTITLLFFKFNGKEDSVEG